PVRPGAAESSLALAEIDVAFKHDAKAGHEHALAGLKQSPKSVELYEYLRHLDQLVLKTDVNADIGAPPAEVAAQLAADRKAALDLINPARAQAGLGALAEDPALDQSTQAHAYYYLFNMADQSVAGPGIQPED